MATPAAPPTTLERLRVFHAVVVGGTVAGAARQLGYTASAVSQQVSALERDAGIALVERSNRGVTPTAAGRTLAGHAADLLDRARGAFDDVAALANAPALQLAVAAFPSAVSTLLLPARQHLAPQITVLIVDAESEAALQLVISREVDAAIVDGEATLRGRNDDGHGRLHRTLLGHDPFRLVGRSGHRPASGRSVLAALADRPWVLAGATSRLGRVAREHCHRAGFDPHVIAETEDHHVAFEVIQAAGAVSLLPQMALTRTPAGIAVFDTDLDVVGFGRRVELVTRPAMRSHPAVGALTDAVSRSFPAGSTAFPSWSEEA